MEQEQEQQVSKLMRKISKLEKETATKQITLEQVCCSEHTCICVWDACMCVIVMRSYYDDVALKLYTYLLFSYAVRR